MSKTHHYDLQLHWTGNTGSGTSDYRSYERDYRIESDGKPPLLGSSDPAFRGDPTHYNPEEMLLAALSSCHLLWFLHLCAEAKVVVTAYTDAPTGVMIETPEGGGQFSEVTLRPRVTVSEASMLELLPELHQRANERCFIARSVNFPVKHEANGFLA